MGSGLPTSLAPLPRSPALPCTPCVEGQQRAAPHSSLSPPTTAPLHALHLDVWAPSSVLSPRQECFFLIVVDDYSRYTTVFPLRRKADVPTVLEPWLLARGGAQGMCRLCLQSDHGVGWTSMCHTGAPQFLWPQGVRYAAHQLNLWPRDARPRVTPVFLRTGSQHAVTDYRVWGSLAHVRARGMNKLSPSTRACVFLGFPLDSSGWQFYDPVTCQFFSSQGVTFDDSPPPPSPHPSHPAPLSVSHVTPQSSPPLRPFLVVSGVAGGAAAEGEGTGAAGAGGAGSEGAGCVGVEATPVEDTTASTWRPRPSSPLSFPGVSVGGTGGTEGVVGGGSGSGGAGVGGARTLAPTPYSVRSLTRAHHLLRLEREERLARVEEEPHPQQQGRVEEEPHPRSSRRSRCNRKRCRRRRSSNDCVTFLTLHLHASYVVRYCLFLLFTLTRHLCRPRGYIALLSVVLCLLGLVCLVTMPTVSFTLLSILVLHPVRFSHRPLRCPFRSRPTQFYTLVCLCLIDAVPSPGANVVSGMWFYKVKRPPGAPPVFKARYVARGFSQQEGVDFFQTFAPTPKMTTLRALLHVAQRDYELHSLDFSTADLVAAASTGLPPVPDSPRVARHALHDPCSTWFPLVVCPPIVVRPPYLDDLVFENPHRTALASVKEELRRRHTCTDLGELQRYLGLQITRDRAARTITLTQSHMVKQILTRFCFPFSKVQLTPLAVGSQAHGSTFGRVI
ncbi:unnamed protein product [Closterium sp. NIES-53]